MRMAQILALKILMVIQTTSYIDGHASTKIIIAFIGQKKLVQILRPADLEASYSIKTSA